ncbi:MAG: subtilisin-like proprotein convertase family protein [Parvicellaceae bacterium]|jgi:subtilisin-like proprotein convertase family protein
MKYCLSILIILLLTGCVGEKQSKNDDDAGGGSAGANPFTIENSPPQATEITHSGVVSLSQLDSVGIFTNKASTCKFDTIPFKEFFNMNYRMQSLSNNFHRIEGPNFQAGQAYQYYIKCMDPLGNISPQDINLAFSVDPAVNNLVPIIVDFEPRANLAIGTNQVIMKVITNSNANCKYSDSPIYLYDDVRMLTMANFGPTDHRSTIMNLQNGASYAFYVRCRPSSSNNSASDTGSTPIVFEVGDILDNTPPLILLALPTGEQASGTTSSTLIIQTNEDSQCRFNTSSATTFLQKQIFSSTDAFIHSHVVLGLGPNIDYNYYVQCRDAKDNVSEQATINFNIREVNDGVPPLITVLAPNNILTFGDTEELVIVSTNERANCRGSKQADGYNDMSDFTQTGEFSHTVTVSNLITGINTYYVRCSDSNGNLSIRKLINIQVNEDTTDRTGPSISNARPSGVFPSSTSFVDMQVDTNEVSNCFYTTEGTGIDINQMSVFANTAQANAHTQRLQGFISGTTYNYYIKCRDFAGNISTNTATLTFTIQAEAIPATPTPPPPPQIPDPLLPYAWHLENIGQTNFSLVAGVAGEDLRMTQALANNLQGTGIRVAVSDDGLEVLHEDLADNTDIGLSRNYSGAPPWDGRNPTHANDSVGHGTAVGGLIGAVSGNGKGSRGVSPGVTLAGFKFLDTLGDDNDNTLIAKYIDQATGAFDIFNYSYGVASCEFYENTLSDALVAQLKAGTETLRNGKGTIYVKAAGNEYIGDLSDCNIFLNASEQLKHPFTQPLYLGNASLSALNANPYVVLVGANNALGDSTSYSSPGPNIWVSAPGGEFGSDDDSGGLTLLNTPALMTTDFSGCARGFSQAASTRNSFDDGHPLNLTCNYISSFNGTSSASPNTAGAIALILEANPNLSWRDVKHILAQSAIRINPNAADESHPGGSGLDVTNHTYAQGWVRNNAGYYYHRYYGFGAVAVDAAIARAKVYNTNLGTFSDTVIGIQNGREIWANNSGTVNIAIPDNSAVGAVSDIAVATNYITEAIQIRVTVAHPFISDLGVEITSPSGTKSILMNINSGVYGEMDQALFLSNAFYGEQSAGTWRLKVIDGRATNSGMLTNWQIKIMGHTP